MALGSRTKKPSRRFFKSSSKSAFSFVEIMVAVVILALALPIFLFIRTGRKAVEGTRDIATATYLASQALETIQSWDYSTLCEEDLQANPQTTQGGAPKISCEASYALPEKAEVRIGNMVFQRKVDIQPLTSPTATEVKIANVQVDWNRGNLSLHYEVSTVVSRAR